jgi:twitching motility two-component system response regulator PilG
MSGLSQPVILVIDADSLSLTETSTALTSQRYFVSTAGDRESAITAATQLNLDLIICDVNLNGDDGVELCRVIRQLPNCNDVPVMFLSNNQMPSVASRLFSNGSALYLKKPFAVSLLLDLVDKALWMPHLIKSHEHRPHIPMGVFAKDQSRSSGSVSQ